MSHQDHKAFHKNLLSSDSAGRLIGSHTQSCATNEAGHQDIKCFLPWGGGGGGDQRRNTKSLWGRGHIGMKI